MKLGRADIARMIDLSAVRAGDDESRIRLLAETARRFGCVIATTLPTHTPLLVRLLADAPATGVSGNVGFPAGSSSTAVKVAETRELLDAGCDEIDMVMNIGLHRSGHHGRVADDIRAVVEAAGKVPVKVILECHHLDDNQIRTACGLCVEAGAAFVKTGTGWTPTGATLENVALVRSCVGDAVAIKASGGIRGIDTLAEMHRRGARRFGIGLDSVARLFEQLDDLHGGTIDA